MEIGVPSTKPVSLWEATATPSEQFPSLTGDIRTEIAVVGGGFTGLSCALHLSEASRDVVVLEGHYPGWGASGRNGGQVIPGLKFDPDDLEEMFGTDLGPRVVKTVGSAADYLFSTIRRHSIDCDAVQSGWIQPAHSPAALKTTDRRAQQWIRRGAPARLLDQNAVAALIGSKAYFGGWIDLRGGSIQPLSYARGLASAAKRCGARIFSQTPALSAAQSGHGWRLETPQGRVFADKLIFSTNAYTDSLWPGLRRTIVHTFSVQVATVPLPDSVRRTILPAGQAASDTLRLLRYFRIDRTGRLVLGGRGPFKDAVGYGDATEQIRAISQLFPQLSDTKFSFVWSGQVAMTADHLPHLHELAPGVYAALGFNGRGVALTTTMGKLLAQLSMGANPEEIDFPIIPLKPLPLHGFNRLAVKLLTQYYRFRDSVE
jgi:glycine/D-amino acid oxidase-like deaminating enzyme